MSSSTSGLVSNNDWGTVNTKRALADGQVARYEQEHQSGRELRDEFEW